MASGMQKKIVCLGVMTAVLLALMNTAANATMVKLENVPDYQWTDGCSPTAATMMMAYYAINGYAGRSYSNFIPGGPPPLNTFNNPNALVTNAISTMAQDMGTIGGGTTFHFYTNGGKFTPQDALSNGLQAHDGTYGLYKYVQDAGYDANIFTEQISNANADRFTFADFETDINEGRPVLLSLFGTVNGVNEGHTVLVYGYDDSTMSIYIRDTWASGGFFGGGMMQWGGTYDGMSLYIATDLTLSGGMPLNFSEINTNSGSAPFPLPFTGINTNILITGGTDINPYDNSPVPEPATMILFGTGIAGFIGLRFRKKRAYIHSHPRPVTPG